MNLAVEPRDWYQRRNVIDARALDKVAHKVYSSDGPVDQLTLDLSAASFIDHDCLLLIGGLFAERRRMGLDTMLKLPENDSVLDFLRAWRFPEFLMTINQAQPFIPESVELLNSSNAERRPRYVSFMWGPDGNQHPVTLLKSLAITDVRLTDDPWADATAGSRRFLLRNFQTVIKRTLGKAAGSQIADVVREAVLNASAHPRATLAFTSSHFRPRLADSHDETDAGSAMAELQFSIWDDGDPIAATLRRALKSSTPITSERFGEEGVVFRVRIEQVPEGYERVLISDFGDSRFSGSKHDDSVLLTCAAFMLGVSSDPVNTPRRRPPDSGPRTAGGVGLAIIRQAALDSNWGRIEYRSGPLRLTATKARDRGSVYDFEVSVVPQGGWQIRGNLLTVTMPLREPQ